MRTQIIKSDYETMIFTFRAKKVMVDYDLASRYEVPTKAMKQQVKRNQSRFPEDFMFELSDDLFPYYRRRQRSSIADPECCRSKKCLYLRGCFSCIRSDFYPFLTQRSGPAGIIFLHIIFPS